MTMYRSNSSIKLRPNGLPSDLTIARKLAKQHAEGSPLKCCTLDDIRADLELLDIDLGPSAGSLFEPNTWVFTGERVKSKHNPNHARELKVWRLKSASTNSQSR